MKFKVGDKVIIREDLEVGSIYDGWGFNCIMAHYKGRKAIIIKVNRGSYRIDLDGGIYLWTDEMLEPCKELNKEHYAKEIIEIATEGEYLAVDKNTKKPTTCNKINCEDCIGYDEHFCSKIIKEWANSEYVESKPPVKLTQFEYEYLKRLKDDGYKYLARDEDNSIHAFTIEPYYDCHDWFVVDNDYYYVFEDLFIFVRRQDEKPCSIDYILENCEVIENVD